MAMQAKLWTVSELSVELDIDRRTMAKRLEGCDPEESETDKGGREHRRYRLAAVFAHLMGGDASVLKLDDERARLAHEQADRAAMENEVRRGELLDQAQVAPDLEQAFVTFRQSLLGAGTKLGPLVNPERPNAARDTIDAEHERILTRLAEHFDAAASAQLRASAEAPSEES